MNIKVLLPVFLAVALLANAAPVVPLGPQFSTKGNWRFGSLDGYAPNRGTIWTGEKDATATWTPNVQSVCPVRVSFYVVAHGGNTPAAIVQVTGATEQKLSKTFDLSAGESRWETVGTFPFAGKGGEKIVLSNGGSGNLRVSAVRLEILDPQDAKMVWQTLILDEIIPSAEFREASVEFDDMKGHPAADVAGRLAAAGVLGGTTPKKFAPEAEMTPEIFLSALLKISGEKDPGTAGQITTKAATRGWLGGSRSLWMRLLPQNALGCLVAAAEKSGKPLAWAHLPQDKADVVGHAAALGFLDGPDDPIAKQTTPLKRSQAAVLLGRYQQIIAQSGPPAGEWELTFQDEFNGSALDPEVWNVAKGQTWGKLLSGRWPENIVVEKGLLKLVTKKEKRGGLEWTSGMAGTKKFRQKFGYWEARYRYAGAPGLNNAFWTNPGIREPGKGFEIDVNEGHWPNAINMSLHQNGMTSLSKCWRAPVDLSKDFHTYGVLWEEKEIVYFWDGREIDRKPNTVAVAESPVIFSTAVFPWAGPITSKLDGKSMDVDWVRVYQRKR